MRAVTQRVVCLEAETAELLPYAKDLTEHFGEAYVLSMFQYPKVSLLLDDDDKTHELLVKLGLRNEQMMVQVAGNPVNHFVVVQEQKAVSCSCDKFAQSNEPCEHMTYVDTIYIPLAHEIGEVHGK